MKGKYRMKTLSQYVKDAEANIYEASEMLPKPKDMAELLKACKKNALFKAIEKQCKAIGYTLIDAHMDYYNPSACIPTVRIAPPSNVKMAPSLQVNADKGYSVQVVPVGGGALDVKDAETWAFLAQKVVDLAKWLNKQDWKKLPTFTWENA